MAHNNRFNTRRWVRFNVIGIVGFFFQLGCLWTLTRVNIHYVIATAIAVELTVLHNFAWHSRWTWGDRPVSPRAWLCRFTRFNLTNGAISIGANTVLTVAVVETWHLHYLVANAISVVVCSVANFAVSDLLVFASILLFASNTPTKAAELRPTAVTAFDRYAALIELRTDREARGELPFLWMDALPDEERIDARARLQRGEIVVQRQRMIDELPFPSALCHHWIGTVLVPHAPLSRIVEVMQAYDEYPRIYSPAVRRARTLASDGLHFQVHLQLYQKNVLSVVLNTESAVSYARVSARRIQVRSVSTRIAEVSNPDSGQEGEKPVGNDNGFLWRFNNYCALEERAEGTYVQCETVSLSRDVPFGLSWLVRPFVTAVPKDSLEFTLRALRHASI